MAAPHAVTREAGTSWVAVLSGWIATLGASVLFAPLVAALVSTSGADRTPSDVAVAVPVVLGILLSYLVGGYVAGRMAGYRTSWHGMMTAFFSLFILLLVFVVGALADSGVFAGSGVRSLTDVIPGVRDLNVASLGDALSFGAILGFLAAIFGGWLGGLLAPTRPLVAAGVPRPRTTSILPGQPVRRDRETARERWAPAYGHKGGERIEERHVEEHDARDDVEEASTTRIDRER